MGSNGEDDAMWIEGGYIIVVRGERKVTKIWKSHVFFLSASLFLFLPFLFSVLLLVLIFLLRF